jgi:hypothetical protein
MEKTIWKGTFEEAEEKDDRYWADQSEEVRLATLIEIRDILLDSQESRIEKVAFKKRLGEED